MDAARQNSLYAQVASPNRWREPPRREIGLEPRFFEGQSSRTGSSERSSTSPTHSRVAPRGMLVASEGEASVHRDRYHEDSESARRASSSRWESQTHSRGRISNQRPTDVPVDGLRSRPVSSLVAERRQSQTLVPQLAQISSRQGTVIRTARLASQFEQWVVLVSIFSDIVSAPVSPPGSLGLLLPPICDYLTVPNS